MGNWAFWSGHKQSRTIRGSIEPVILIFLLVSSTDGFSQELFQVPARNTVLIASVRPAILDDASLIRHLHFTDSLVEANMEEEDMQLAVAVMQQFQPTDSITLSDVANGFWISASHAPALFLMGKACLADQDPDNLNNYAAFLEMAGRPDLAIPILNRLNKEYPNHSTVLNNIGQAWLLLKSPGLPLVRVILTQTNQPS